MSRQPSSRDLTKLSAYLDGELSASASRKMKSRLARDPNLLAALDDLRETKSILQRIPKRRSPRNFTLSPQMVAKSPPMPRAYPVFRFASAVAFILLFFSALPNFGAPMNAADQMVMEAAAPAIENFAGAEAEEMMEMPVAEAPALAQAESAPAEEAPAAPEEPAAPEADAEKATADRAEEAIISTPTAMPTQIVSPTPETLAVPPTEPSAQPASPQRIWQIVLVVLAIFFALGAFILRRRTISKWRKGL